MEGGGAPPVHNVLCNELNNLGIYPSEGWLIKLEEMGVRVPVYMMMGPGEGGASTNGLPHNTGRYILLPIIGICERKYIRYFTWVGVLGGRG